MSEVLTGPWLVPVKPDVAPFDAALALVRLLVAEFGAEVTGVDALDPGDATFTLRIPVAEPVATEEPPG